MPHQSNRVSRTCRQCGAAFDVKPSRLRYGGALWCSRACYYRSRTWVRAKTPNEAADVFWSRVAKSDAPDACWPWLGRPNTEGYGRMMVNGERQLAHRIAYQLANGPIPDGLLVCHSCDNPPCCNPAHLWVGTDGDNSEDKAAKGRAQRLHGTLTGTAKLTDEHVLAIRERRQREGTAYRTLAADFGVSACCVRHIVLRKTWRHI